MKLVFSDEFDYEGKPNPEKWIHETGNDWHNNEQQYYTDNERNAFVKDGKLHIVALLEDMGTRKYTSARLTTYGKYSFTYGRVEMRAKLPTGVGSWPAFWMLSDAIHEGTGWPLSGEIDIMEYAHGVDPTEMHVSLHSELYNHSIGTQETFVANLDGLTDDFHTYTCDWEKDKVTFLFDDKEIATFYRDKRSNGEPKEQGEAAWPFDQPFHILLNLAVGGFFAHDKIVDEDLPFTYEIDYVKVWQK